MVGNSRYYVVLTWRAGIRETRLPRMPDGSLSGSRMLFPFRIPAVNHQRAATPCFTVCVI